MGARKVRCRICDGTGFVEAGMGGGRGQSDSAVLRSGLAGAWDVIGAHERFLASMYETACQAI